MSLSARALVVFAVAAVALIALATVSFSVYTQADLDAASANWLSLLSPVFAAVVPTFAAIALGSVRRARAWRLIVGGALLAATLYIVPLYVGLKQQHATDQQLAFAATFISWLG